MLCFTFVLAVLLASMAVVNAGVDDRQCRLSSTKQPITCSGDIPINCSAPGTVDYVFQMWNGTAAEFQNVTAGDDKSCLRADYTSGIGLYTFTPGDLNNPPRGFHCIAYNANGASINEIDVQVEFHSDEKNTWKLKSGPSQTKEDAGLKYSSEDSFSAPQATGVCSSDFMQGNNRLEYTVCFLDEKESDLYDVTHTPCLLARGVIRCCQCGSICPGLPNVTTKETLLGNDKLACNVSTSREGQIVCLGKIVNSNDKSQYITNQVIGSYKTVLPSHSQNLDLPEWSYFVFGVTVLLFVSVSLLSASVVAVHYMRRRKRRAGYQRICDDGERNPEAPVHNCDPYQQPDNTPQTVGVPPRRRCPPAAKGMSSLDPSGSSTFTPARGGDESEGMGSHSDVQETQSRTPSGSTFPEMFTALDEHPVKIHLLAQFICGMAPQWLPIATQLGPKVSEKAHSNIDKRQCFDNEKMTRVLNSWIDSGENVCWSNILSAIHKVGMQSLTQEMLNLLPDLLTSQAKPSVDAERYDGIPVSLPLVADFVQRMCGEWYRIASCFGGRTANEAHGQIDLDPSPASTKMSKVIEVWIGSVDGDVRWSVLTDALRTVGLGGVANSIEQRLDEQLSPLDSDVGPGGGPTEEEHSDPAPAKTMRSVTHSKGSGSSSFPSSSDGPTPTGRTLGFPLNVANVSSPSQIPAKKADEKNTWKLKSGPSQTKEDAGLKYSSGDSFSAPQATGVCSSDFTRSRNSLEYTVCFLEEKESDLYDVAHTPCLLARGVIRCCRCGSICPGLPNVTTKETLLGNDKLACNVSTSREGQIVCLGKIVNSNDNSQYITNQVIGSYKTVLPPPHSQNLDLPVWSYIGIVVTGLLCVSVPLLSAIVMAVHCMRRKKRRAGYQPIPDGEEGAGDPAQEAPVDNRPDNTQQTVPGVPPRRRCPPAAKGMSTLDPSGSSTFTPARGGDESEGMGSHSDVQETQSRTPSGSTFPEMFTGRTLGFPLYVAYVSSPSQIPAKKGDPKGSLSGVASGSSPSLPSKIPAVEGVHAKPTASELWKHAGQHMHSEWHIFGVLLQVSENILKSIKQEYLLSSKDCFISLSQQWLRRGSGTGEELRTWRTVLEAVKECGFPDLAKKVKTLILQGKLNEPEPSGSDYGQPPGVLRPLSALEAPDMTPEPPEPPAFTAMKRLQPCFVNHVHIDDNLLAILMSKDLLTRQQFRKIFQLVSSSTPPTEIASYLTYLVLSWSSETFESQLGRLADALVEHDDKSNQVVGQKVHAILRCNSY